MSKLLAKIIAVLFLVTAYVTMNMNKEYEIDTNLDDVWLWGKK